MMTFTNWLVEMKQSNVGKIGAYMNKYIHEPEKTVFNDIFQGNKRILISPDGDTNTKVYDFIRKLKENSIDVTLEDLKKGMIKEVVKTQQGEKIRQVAVGTVLSRKKLKDMLDDWAVVKEKVDNMSDWSVIVTRYPLDLLRMSDHVDEKGYQIHSCHSPDGGWFRCAIQEAKTGGAVAYAVKTDDLAKIKDIQAKEIFKDVDRNVDGIVPLERVRLRRFYHQKYGDLLVPEIRTYHSRVKIEGFQQLVADWAMEVQEKKIEELIKAFGNIATAYDKMDFRGGFYQDNDTSQIWNNFFGTNIKRNKKPSIDQGNSFDGKDQYLSAEDWEDQAQDFLEEHSANWKHNDDITVWYSAEDVEEGDAYGNWNAEITHHFEEGEEGITSIPRKVEEIKGIRDFLNKKYPQIDKINYKFDSIHGCRVVVISKRSPDEYGELDEFEGFLDGVDTLDEEYDEVHKLIVEFFIHKGFGHNPITHMHKEYNYKNFVLEFLGGNEDNHYYLKMKPMELSLEGFPASFDVCFVNNKQFHFSRNVAVDRPPFVRTDEIERSGIHIENGWWELFIKDKPHYEFFQKMKESGEFTADFKVDLYVMYGMNYRDQNLRIVFDTVMELDNSFQQFQQNVKKWWEETKIKCRDISVRTT